MGVKLVKIEKMWKGREEGVCVAHVEEHLMGGFH